MVNKENNKDKMRWFLPTLGILMFLSIFIPTIFTEQERDYEFNSCKELRECIILEVSCQGESTTYNNLFGYEWVIKNRLGMNSMKEAYKEECFKLNIVKE